MNISVYFYDEEGYFTFMEMAPLQYDDDGVQILPENSTNIFPPPLGTVPRFDKGLNKWIPTKELPPDIPPTEPEPTLEEKLLKEIKVLKEEMTKTQQAFEETQKLVSDLRKQSGDCWVLAQRLQYGMVTVFPNYRHYFD